MFPSSTGSLYIKNDGSIYRFCSSKCRKSMLELGRDPRKLKWTEYYGKKERGK
jgi:large subunit ribosomal protein L24e